MGALGSHEKANMELEIQTIEPAALTIEEIKQDPRFQRTASTYVYKHVYGCVSGLVSSLAGLYGVEVSVKSNYAASSIPDMVEQAFELACPTENYEEAADWHIRNEAEPDELREYFDYAEEDEGALRRRCAAQLVDDEDLSQKYCEEFHVDPYEVDYLEHWLVSGNFAHLLQGRGEKVGRIEGIGPDIWARRTSGQAISIDYVVEEIVASLIAKGYLNLED